MLSRERWIPTTGNYLNHRPVLCCPRGVASPASAAAAAAAATAPPPSPTPRSENPEQTAPRPAPAPAPRHAATPAAVTLGHPGGQSRGPGKVTLGGRRREGGKAEENGDVERRRQRGTGERSSAHAAFPASRSAESRLRPAAARRLLRELGKRPEPGSRSGRGLPRSLPAARLSHSLARSLSPSLPPRPPARRGARSRAPSPYWHPSPACRKRVAPRRAS